MKRAILDTDTVSYYFRKEPKVVEKVDSYVDAYGSVSLSVVTYYEVMNGLYFKDAKKQLKQFEDFLRLCEVIPITLSSAKISAKIFAGLRNTGQLIGHNDALIAGNAMEGDLTLITNNVRDFGKIKGLRIENWTLRK